MADNKRKKDKRFGIPARALFGNAAVDLEQFSDYIYGTGALNPSFDERRTPQQLKAEAERQTERKYKPGISPLIIAGCVLLAVTAAFVLLANAQLAELNAENTALESEYARLSQENRLLTVEYEAAFNRFTLEEYSTNVLGMAKPTLAQVVTLPELTEDKTVILCDNLGEESFTVKARNFLSSLLEYIA